MFQAIATHPLALARVHSRVRPATQPIVPAAPGLPLIANAVDLLVNPLAFFVRSFHDVGPVFRAAGPGRGYTVLAGPEANRFLLHEGERYLDNKPIYARLAGQLMSANYPIATDGARHLHLRRTIKAGFSHEALARYAPRMIATADRIAREWRPGQRLRVLETMHRLVGEQLGLAMANRPLGELLGDAVTFARFSVGAGLGAYPAVMARFPHYLLAKRRMLAFMREVVAAHRADPPGVGRDADFVDLLLAATDAEGRAFADEDVIANAQMVYSNSLLYGAPACAFLLYGLLRHPEALARVCVEVDALFAGGAPDALGLLHAKLLRAAALESMRLYPIALATPRVVAKPFSFAGYELEAGTVTLWAVSVCHFLPEVFPEPYAFDIDRYGEPRNEHRHAGMLVRFGLGAHACMGAGLVDALMMTTVVAMLRNVDLALDPLGYQLRRVVNPFPEPEAGFVVRVTARRD
jgi:cytochrome P450